MTVRAHCGLTAPKSPLAQRSIGPKTRVAKENWAQQNATSRARNALVAKPTRSKASARKNEMTTVRKNPAPAIMVRRIAMVSSFSALLDAGSRPEQRQNVEAYCAEARREHRHHGRQRDCKHPDEKQR